MTTNEELLEVCMAAVNAGGAVLVEGLSRDKQVVSQERALLDRHLGRRDAAGRDLQGHRRALPDALDPRRGRRRWRARHQLLTWIVDPLDGTSNYAAGIPFACMSVAVKDARRRGGGGDLRAVPGRAATRRRAVAAPGSPASGWRCRHNDSLARALVATGLQSDDPAADRRPCPADRGPAPVLAGARGFGSPALCMAYVAAGRLDAFYERDATYAWDVAAGSLMIAEAGGRCEDLDGGPLNLGHGVANVLAHQRQGSRRPVRSDPAHRPSPDRTRWRHRIRRQTFAMCSVRPGRARDGRGRGSMGAYGPWLMSFRSTSSSTAGIRGGSRSTSTIRGCG